MKRKFLRKISLTILATFSVFFLIGAGEEISETFAAQIRPATLATIVPAHNLPEAINPDASAKVLHPRVQGNRPPERRLPEALILISTCVLRR